MKTHALIVSDLDRRAWELATKVPKMPILKAYPCALANLLVAGLGTFISSFLSDRNLNKTQAMMGITQFLTSPFLVGWILSIYWGYLLAMGAQSTKSQENVLLLA